MTADERIEGLLARMQETGYPAPHPNDVADHLADQDIANGVYPAGSAKMDEAIRAYEERAAVLIPQRTWAP